MYNENKRNFMNILLTFCAVGILLLGSFTGSAKPAYMLTVETDQYYYFPGEIVYVSGRLTEDGTGLVGDVCITVTDPDETPVFSVCTVTTSEGYYDVNVPLLPDAMLGVYAVTSETESHSLQASTTFEVIEGYRLTVTTNQSQYHPGGEVNITGRLTENGSGVPSGGVCVNVTDPNETPVFGICLYTGPEGYFEFPFPLAPDARLGTYTVTAENASHNLQASTTFDVIAELRCGDVNKDGEIGLGDVIKLLNYLFRGGEGPDPGCLGDANTDGNVGLGDAVFILNYLFRGGPEPDYQCCNL